MNGIEFMIMRVVVDFSLMNCRFLYISIIFVLLWFMLGVGGNCFSNFGFLVFEYYM